MGGVTPNGYVLKTQAEINAEAETALELIVDPQTGDNLVADLSDPSDIISEVTAITLEGVGDGLLVDQAAYNQYNPNGATGDALSTLVLINGIKEVGATASTVLLNFTGTPLTTVLATEQIKVSDVNNANLWLVVEDIVFDISGDAVGVAASCETLGNIEAAIGTLVRISTPNADISTATNPAIAIVGTDQESDTNLRRRRDQSTQAPAVGLPGSIKAVIDNVEGVTFSRFYNNNTSSVDANGIPAKTAAAVVVGGDDTDVARVIFERSSLGGDYVGNLPSPIVFTDNQSFDYSIQFYRPVAIDIYVIVNISLTVIDNFPGTGAQQIKENIVTYSTGGAPALGIVDGYDQNGFPPGGAVIYSRLYTAINKVDGFRVNSLFIGIAPAPIGTVDIPIAFNDVSRFDTANIEVNIV